MANRWFASLPFFIPFLVMIKMYQCKFIKKIDTPKGCEEGHHLNSVSLCPDTHNPPHIQREEQRT